MGQHRIDDERARATAEHPAPAEAAAALGPMPEWQLDDLYSSPRAPEIDRDFAAAAAEAKRIRGAYQGKLAALAGEPAALAEAVAAYERLSDLMGRLGSDAGLLFAGDQSDPARAKFYGDANEKLTNISADLIFFELELNGIEDEVLAAALAAPALERYRPWFRDLRAEKPHQLAENLEQVFHEKAQTSRAARL